MNLVTRRPAPGVACGAPTAEGRLLFALPWQGQLAIGTWHGAEPCGADAAMVTPQEFDAFLAGVNQAFPALKLTADDVTLVQRGVVPAVGLGQHVTLADRPLLREHRHDGVDGAISLMGVKYTTARALAEQAVTLVTAQLGRHAPSTTASAHLPGYEPTGTPPPVRGSTRARGITWNACTATRPPASPRSSRPHPPWASASSTACPSSARRSSKPSATRWR